MFLHSYLLSINSDENLNPELCVLLPLSICMIMHLSMFDVLSIYLHFICMYMFMGLVAQMFGV